MDIENYLLELKDYGLKNHIPNISKTNAKLLRDIIKIGRYKRALEIGTANGYSSINLALALKDNNGSLTTIEFSEKSHIEALENFKNTGLLDIINPIFGDALDEIPKLNHKYDFIFIDGMKRRTLDFLKLSLDKIDTGGTIIIDDVIKFKDKMGRLYEYLDSENIAYNILPIDPDDGVIMIVR